MEYFQKIIPAGLPVLQVPEGRDVISYRIEHIRTAKKPLQSGQFERDYLYYVPEKYLYKYIDGLKIAPFVRIYRTTAPHYAVEEAVRSGADRISIFNNPRLVEGAVEEACYSTFAEEWTDRSNPKFFMVGLSAHSSDFRERELSRERQFIKEKDEYISSTAPKLKHRTNKFIRKCLAVDDFLDDVMKYLTDPSNFYRKEILKKAVKLDCIFEECKGLDEKMPEGFSDRTSALTKRKVAELLSVVETLKWQVGINTVLDREILKRPFETENVLWSSNKSTSVFYEKEAGYVKKKIVRNLIDSGRTVGLWGEPRKSITAAFESNPHKKPRNFKVRYFWEAEAKNEINPWENIKRVYWTGKDSAAEKLIDRIYRILDLSSVPFWGEELNRAIQAKAEAFNEQFIEGFLEENADRYPAFLSERLRNPDEYPGIIFYMFDEKRSRHLFERAPLDPLGFGDFVENRCLFTIFDKDAYCTVPFVFDLVYLMDYSETLKAAGKAERKELSVLEWLMKIREADPKDSTASRFLAELAYAEIGTEALLREWENLSGSKNTEKEKPNTTEEAVVAVFEMHRKALTALTNVITTISLLDSSVSFKKDSGSLPSLYEEINAYLLDKILSYSRVPLNEEFGKESVQFEVDILDYVKIQNEKVDLLINKIEHGVDITSAEFVQIEDFCIRIKRVANKISNNLIRAV